jgi:tetratricopeptide (TPR) repeat protein
MSRYPGEKNGLAANSTPLYSILRETKLSTSDGRMHQSFYRTRESGTGFNMKKYYPKYLFELMSANRLLLIRRVVAMIVFALPLALSTSVAAQNAPRSKVSTVGQSAKIHLDHGKAQLEKKRYDIAIRSFSAAIRRDPRLSEAYLLRGKAHDQVGSPQKAIKDFTRFIELNPSDPKGYIFRGDAKNFNREHEAAIQDYGAAIKLAPASPAGYLGRGLAYAGLAKYDEAIKDYQWVLKINPNNAEALGNMGVAYMMAGKPVEAMSYFEKALQHETNPQWRAKMEQWAEKLLQGASAAKQRTKGPTR